MDTTDQQVERELELALQAFHQGDYQESLKRLQQGLSKDPDNPVLRYNQILLHYRSGEVDLALKEWDRARPLLRSTSYWLRALKLVALIYTMQGQWPPAEQNLQAVLESVPDDKEALNMLAHIAVQQGDVLTALESYSQVLEQDPENLTALNGAAYAVTLIEGDYAKALRYVQQALTKDQKNPAYWHTAAVIYARGEQWDKADKAIRQAAALAPENEVIRSAQDRIGKKQDPLS
jgi:Tfp pilus assembly protein PilF